MIETKHAFYLLGNAERTKTDNSKSQYELFARFAAVGSAISNLIDSCMKNEEIDFSLLGAMLKRDLETHIEYVSTHTNQPQKIHGMILHKEYTIAKTTLIKTQLFTPSSVFVQSIGNRVMGNQTKTTSQFYGIAKANYLLGNRQIDGTRLFDNNGTWNNPFENSQHEQKNGSSSSARENEVIPLLNEDDGKLQSTKNNDNKIALKSMNEIKIRTKRNNNSTSNNTTKKKRTKVPAALERRKASKEDMERLHSLDDFSDIPTADKLESRDKEEVVELESVDKEDVLELELGDKEEVLELESGDKEEVLELESGDKEEVFENGFVYEDIINAMEGLDYLNLPRMTFFDEETNRSRNIRICCQYHCSRPKKCIDGSVCPYEASHGKELEKLDQKSLNEFIHVCKEYKKNYKFRI